MASNHLAASEAAVGRPRKDGPSRGRHGRLMGVAGMIVMLHDLCCHLNGPFSSLPASDGGHLLQRG
jgi:hypothetical protein